MSDQRPYAALLAKGDDRKQRIVSVAQRLLIRNGWRNTTLGQIAQGAGISAAGLLHHFDSKEQLLHAVLDARDTYDDLDADTFGDVPEQVGRVADRYRRAPDLVGMFGVLLIENLEPDAPLRERLLSRQRDAVDIIAEAIRQGQSAGRYRVDLNPRVKAVEILAFVHGMETLWLFDPTIPLNDVFREYSSSLAEQFAPPSSAP
jgi:AcrR family transcriptional regulator